MKVNEIISDKEFIFGSIMTISNNLETLLERELKDFGITAKQWMLMVVISNMNEKNPTIKEVSKELGTSHQNVKQLALKLENKGHISIKKDPQDGRVSRLVITEKSYEFWQKLEPRGYEFVESVLKGIPQVDLTKARKTMGKILENIEDM